LFEPLPIIIIGMMIEQFSVELQPDLFHRIGPRRIGGERNQFDPRTIVGEVIQDIEMRMHKPVVQGHKDPFSLGIVLIDKAEEARHLPFPDRYSSVG